MTLATDDSSTISTAGPGLVDESGPVLAEYQVCRVLACVQKHCCERVWRGDGGNLRIWRCRVFGLLSCERKSAPVVSCRNGFWV